MNDMELLEQSKNLVQNVFERMTEVESLGKLKESVEVGNLGIVMKDGGVLSLNILSQDQVDKAKNCIVQLIEDNMEESRRFLSRLTMLSHKSEINNFVKETEQSSQDPILDTNFPQSTSDTDKSEELVNNDETELKIENTELKSDSIVMSQSEQNPEEIENQSTYKPWTDRVVLEKMYLQDKKSATQIAQELGCKKQDVYNFLSKYGIKRDNFVPGKQALGKKKKVQP